MGRILPFRRRGDLTCSLCGQPTPECIACKRTKEFDPADCPDIVCFWCYGRVNTG